MDNEDDAGAEDQAEAKCSGRHDHYFPANSKRHVYLCCWDPHWGYSK